MEPAKKQALCIHRLLSDKEFEAYLRIICCVEDPIDTTLTDQHLDNGIVLPAVKIDQVALNVRQGKQAVYAELMFWFRKGERIRGDDGE